MKLVLSTVAATVIWVTGASAQEARDGGEPADSRREDIVVTAARTNLPASACR